MRKQHIHSSEVTNVVCVRYEYNYLFTRSRSIHICSSLIYPLCNLPRHDVHIVGILSLSMMTRFIDWVKFTVHIYRNDKETKVPANSQSWQKLKIAILSMFGFLSSSFSKNELTKYIIIFFFDLASDERIYIIQNI